MALIYVTAAWVVGITLGALLSLPLNVWLWLLALPVGYLLIWWRDRDLRRLHYLFLVVIVFPFDLPNGLRFSRGASPVAPSADGCKRR